MKKGLVIFANGFEDSEGIVTIDILKRAQIGLDIVSIKEKNVITQCQNHLVVNKVISEVKYSDYDFLFIPGGSAVKNVLSKIDLINEVILSFAKEKKLIATICAAPSLVGKLGLFENEIFTCYPGCEIGIPGKYNKKGVNVSHNFITGKSMGYSIDFALEIVSYLEGKEKSKKVEDSIYGK